MKKMMGNMVILAVTSAAYSGSTDTATGSPIETPSFIASETTISSIWSMRGLTQTVSAESAGEGKLTLSLTPTWYGQKANPPLQEAGFISGILSFCYGLNPFVDIFGSIAGYGVLSDSGEYGKGSFSLGLKGMVPLDTLSPLRLGVMISVISGTSSRTLNENSFYGTYFPYRTNSDGYDYFETETCSDFVGKFIETLIFGNDSLGIKLHFNQGAALLMESSNRQLMLLGAGIQGSVHPKIVLGLELNSRTNANDINLSTDPLWLTQSFLLRTPYHFNALLGVDVSLSRKRPVSNSRALEPFRVFGSISFTMDVLAAKKRAEREKAIREKAESERMVLEAQKQVETKESMARVDSSARANAIDSLKSSVSMLSRKASDDSAMIAELIKKLEFERSKRSDAEKQLLSKGMLLLDAVYFNSGKSKISINSFPYLNIIGKMLTKYPKLQIEVSGHTDNVGNFEKNLTLSQARAESVRKYLIQIAPDLLTRISARGYGPTQPKATNLTKEGRKLNRRTELQVLNKDALQEYN